MLVKSYFQYANYLAGKQQKIIFSLRHVFMYSLCIRYVLQIHIFILILAVFSWRSDIIFNLAKLNLTQPTPVND